MCLTDPSPQAIDSFLDNSSSCLRQLSSISFWDNFDNSLAGPTIGNPASPQDYQQRKAGSASPPAAKESLTKPAKISKSPKSGNKAQVKKTLKRKQDYSALDCTDYWLRFDSDDESLDKSEDFDHMNFVPSRR